MGFVEVIIGRLISTYVPLGAPVSSYRSWIVITNSSFSTEIEIVTNNLPPGDYSFDLIYVTSGEGTTRIPVSFTIIDGNNANKATLNQPKEAINIVVYPNPVAARLTFFVAKSLGTAVDVSLVNILGKQLDIKNKWSLDPLGNGAVDMSDLPPGTYILRVRDISSGVNYQSKIIKN